MFPIRDTIPSKNYPIVNNALIAVNVLVFLLQLTQADVLMMDLLRGTELLHDRFNP